jgi:EmrB/QacA subfamily drug resistance transporter
MQRHSRQTMNAATSLLKTKRWTLAVVCAATAMLMLDIAVVNTALSRIAEDLDTGLSGLQWVVDAYTLALASVVLTAGSLADRFGRRRLFTIGLAVFTAASAACAASTDIVFLDAARAVQGLGAAVMFAVSLALLANAYPDMKERAGALAAYGATIGASFAVGPLVGGALTSGLDWQWIFLINIPIGIACLWITQTKVQESRDPATPPVDWPGQAALTGGLFLLVLALLRGNDQGWGSGPIIAELAGAAALLVAFVAIEARSTHPMLPLRLFRNPSFTGAQVAAFGISASFFAIFLYTTLYLQQVLGLSAIEAGLVYLPGTLLNFVVAGASSQVGEKVSARIMVSAGLGLVAVGMLLFLLAGADSSWTIVLPGELVALFGVGLFNPSVIAVALGSVPAQQSGLAAGVNDTFRQAGIAVGVAGLGALIPAGAGLGGGSPHEFVDGLHNALLAGAGLAAVSAVAAFFLIRKVHHHEVVELPADLALADAA